MKKAKLEEMSNHNSVPIMAWDFHYEYLNELKVTFTDLKKVKEISSHFAWDEENLNIGERLKEEVVVITDVNMKIVFASSGIKKMTGYTESEVLGKTPKMFQGAATSKTDLKEIRKAIELEIPFEKTIKNYKKNGKIYICRIYGSPVFNLKGKLSHYIAFEKEELSA
ncbi:PAS domain-containing protein [Flavobacterium sp. LC2016-23]|uniref:PAS domain-containing protein n=1 Tax=Flavobacterium sp. LC2016-23 TaxID=2666330 RepID=UPI0012B1146B|nr:PAS domain-containing protein [Flavobacterium sp. LC2016-23]MRX40801.1 PAS domain-containing protein [Flavobacterium sp. LC2016-23]